jgi:hypothetical protein
MATSARLPALPPARASPAAPTAIPPAPHTRSSSTATALAPPTDASATAPGASIDAIACGASESCGAAGTYADAGGTPRTMVASQTARSWGAATRRALLGTGYPSDPPPTQPTTQPTPAATPAPVTTAPSAALRPIVVLKTSKFTVSKGAIKVKLGCRTAHCSGTVKLTTTAKRKTVVLAKASYALVRGRTATISVRLPKAGRKALKHSRARAVRAKLVISLKGARTISKTVAIR